MNLLRTQRHSLQIMVLQFNLSRCHSTCAVVRLVVENCDVSQLGSVENSMSLIVVGLCSLLNTCTLSSFSDRHTVASWFLVRQVKSTIILWCYLIYGLPKLGRFKPQSRLSNLVLQYNWCIFLSNQLNQTRRVQSKVLVTPSIHRFSTFVLLNCLLLRNFVELFL